MVGVAGSRCNASLTKHRSANYLCHYLGRDAFGEQIRAGYEKEGIDTTYLFNDRQPTGVASIVVDDRGENCILVVPGANDALTPADVRRAAEAIRSADVLLCQLEVPMAATAEIDTPPATFGCS